MEANLHYPLLQQILKSINGKTLFVLIGHSGAGKSTLSAWLHQHISNSYVVSKDKIRHLRYGYNTYYHQIEENIIHDAISETRSMSLIKNVIIYDAPNLSNWKRQLFVSGVCDRFDTIVYLWININHDIILKRLANHYRKQEKEITMQIIHIDFTNDIENKTIIEINEPLFKEE